MENFDLRKYLAEGRLLKEEVMVNPIIMFGGKEYIEDIISSPDDFGFDENDAEWVKNNILSSPKMVSIQDYMDLDDRWVKQAQIETDGGGDLDHIVDALKVHIKQGLITPEQEKEAMKVVGLAEGRLLKEDVSSGFINKYLSMVEPENFKDIEDIELYSDRDKAIFLYLEIVPGIMVSDELARDLKDKPSEEIVQYFKDRNYSYMPYSAMDKIFGSITPTGMEFERGAPDKVHLDRTHNMRINKILRNKYSDVIDFMKSDRTGGNEIEVHNAIQDRYSDEAKDGRSREVSYEEYASDFADAIRDRM